MLPAVLDERSQALLREFGEINGASRRGRDAGGGPPARPARGVGELTMTKKTERGKAYFMISAVSQKYDIHPQTLRLYEREGLLTPSRTEGQHAAVLGRGSRTAGDHPLAHARDRREPRRRRDHPEHATQDRADAARGQRVHGTT
jgi:hypothetical protein